MTFETNLDLEDIADFYLFFLIYITREEFKPPTSNKGRGNMNFEASNFVDRQLRDCECLKKNYTIALNANIIINIKNNAQEFSVSYLWLYHGYALLHEGRLGSPIHPHLREDLDGLWA
ncbi:23617_t:CDS:2 [Gigaspora margarita]|uniref:23617_t:CDS:1 n=1 Tax=Gigaspora margarita TaxID=4874 RepID=A0ABM8VVW1_GIGMA|nr:23617_t:CDS:2 [Gigaspora margarita]